MSCQAWDTTRRENNGQKCPSSAYSHRKKTMEKQHSGGVLCEKHPKTVNLTSKALKTMHFLKPDFLVSSDHPLSLLYWTQSGANYDAPQSSAGNFTPQNKGPALADLWICRGTLHMPCCTGECSSVWNQLSEVPCARGCLPAVLNEFRQLHGYR